MYPAPRQAREPRSRRARNDKSRCRTMRLAWYQTMELAAIVLPEPEDVAVVLSYQARILVYLSCAQGDRGQRRHNERDLLPLGKRILLMIPSLPRCHPEPVGCAQGPPVGDAQGPLREGSRSRCCPFAAVPLPLDKLGSRAAEGLRALAHGAQHDMTLGCSSGSASLRTVPGDLFGHQRDLDRVQLRRAQSTIANLQSAIALGITRAFR